MLDDIARRVDARPKVRFADANHGSHAGLRGGDGDGGRAPQRANYSTALQSSPTYCQPKRPLMQRWPSVTDESVGEVTLTTRLSWVCSVSEQPTPQ